jgi:hypothetical protein
MLLLLILCSVGCSTGSKAVAWGVVNPVIGLTYYGVKKHADNKNSDREVSQEANAIRREELALEKERFEYEKKKNKK